MLVAFFPFYIRSSLIGGSIILWLYIVQIVSGILLGLIYSWVFDTGLPGVIFFWWESFYGALLARIHSEFGNLVFFMIYVHLLTKFWTSSANTEIDHTWLSGIVILIFTYVAGITGAIMPCSILSEVTATVIGTAISSLSFISFDFLETWIIPGMGLTDDTLSRIFILHSIFPLLVLIIVLDHVNNLHCTEYTDEDELEVIFISRYEYWSEFIWLEIGFWFELLFCFSVIRFNVDFFWPDYMVVSYSMSNFEYWPINEEIDFVLAIPHWYLRPLMSSLVLIPHHYLGFFYIVFFFLFIILFPWFAESTIINFPSNIKDYLLLRVSIDFNILFLYTIILLIAVLTFTALIVPTGRYFVSGGSSEFLIFAFWFLFIFFLFLTRMGAYFLFFYCYYII